MSIHSNCMGEFCICLSFEKYHHFIEWWKVLNLRVDVHTDIVMRGSGKVMLINSGHNSGYPIAVVYPMAVDCVVLGISYSCGLCGVGYIL